MKFLLIGLIRLYQWTLSPVLGQVCRFTPTCSQYAVQALRKYGACYGSWLVIKRICRCNPWCEGGIDEV